MSPASAAAATPWGCFIPFIEDDGSVKMLGVEAGGARPRYRQALGDDSARHGGSAAWQQELSACKTTKAKLSETHSVCGGLGLSRCRPGIELSARLLAGCSSIRRLTMRRSPRSGFLPRSKGSFPPWKAPMRSPWCGAWRPKLKKRQIIIVNLSGRGDKDMITVGDYLGAKL